MELIFRRAAIEKMYPDTDYIQYDSVEWNTLINILVVNLVIVIQNGYKKAFESIQNNLIVTRERDHYITQVCPCCGKYKFSADPSNVMGKVPRLWIYCYE